jgi:AraC family transcriptional regulator of adaptative response / DNA-3-methyladenine glycosylase II
MSENGQSAASYPVFSVMPTENMARFAALGARDARFDGVFYIGVTSTGIYCRPVCTARTPKRANCRFFDSPEAAEQAKFRPCLRCRPELAPGNAPVDNARRIATLLAHRVDEGMVGAEGGAWMERVAQQFGWSSRQIRRVVRDELGVTPMQLVQTRRLLLAKQLLTDTRLPIGDIAFASGFSSLRRFNDAFRAHYRMAPTRFRKKTGAAEAGEHDAFTVRLGYRAPFDWESMLAFLRARETRGVEVVGSDTYSRTVSLAGHTGWIVVSNDEGRRCLQVTMPRELTPMLPALLGRLRGLFDVAARPDVIAAHLSGDPFLAPEIARRPGLRVPGAFDAFELGVRAILGQQITVKAATTLAGRFVECFGEPITTSHAGLTHLAPTAETIARIRPASLVALGVVEARARAIIELARQMANGLSLEPGADPEPTIARLVALPGIGDWTAHYISMRALRWPDAFPAADIVIRKKLGGLTAAAAATRSQRWSPWRSYATLYCWGMP